MGLATTHLRQEHDTILRMLEATEEVARRLRLEASVPADTLQGFLEFFQVFADRCHHGKEEGLLFPRLEQKGLARSGGPIGVLREEHEQGRGLLSEMAASAADYRQGREAAGPRWAEAALRYAVLLRQHIHKENTVLFWVAENLLSQAEQEELAAAFEQWEQEKIGAGTHERLHAWMEKVTTELLP